MILIWSFSHPLWCLTHGTQPYLLNKWMNDAPVLNLQEQRYCSAVACLGLRAEQTLPWRLSHQMSHMKYYTQNEDSHSCDINRAKEIRALSSSHTLLILSKGEAWPDRLGSQKETDCCHWWGYLLRETQLLPPVVPAGASDPGEEVVEG